MKKYYFQTVSILLLFLSLIAFSDNLITDVRQESNSDPKFIVHGLIMFAWFILLVIQANFIRKGDYKAHMKWGKAGMICAVGVFLSTVYVFVAVYESWEAMPYLVKANRFFMLSFAVLIALAYRYRKNGVKHKRLILLASILILEPILSRVSGRLHIDHWELFIVLVWNSLFISLFVYDWLTLKKIHPISWVGFLWFYFVWAISVLVS